ncbi:hypothetical protein F-VV63_0223 [Faustovirus]|nr:hypothetical protein F-VV63_0223 [Faustovirus]
MAYGDWYHCHDIYIKRIGFTLIRVYREQVQREVNASDQVLQSQLKWPVEFIYLGLRPANNVASGNLYQWRDWHHLTSVTNETVYDVSQSYARVSIDDTVAPVGSATYKQSASQVQAGRYTVPVETETIDTVRVKAHGIELYAQYAAQFYRDYIPWNYGSFNLVTPQDKGALFLNFCLYPGTYQPLTPSGLKLMPKHQLVNIFHNHTSPKYISKTSKLRETPKALITSSVRKYVK